jgi:protein-disulfide isomerase
MATEVYRADRMRKNSSTLFRRRVRRASALALLGVLLTACAAPMPPAAPKKPAAADNQRSSHSSGIAYRDTPVIPVTPSLPQLDLGGAHRLGNPRASIGIVEFSDYQCPYCRGFQQQLFPRLKKEYVDSGVVQFIHMDLPLTRIHPQALPAALAAVCAGAQGRFWEMHDALYENALDPTLYAGLARRLKLDIGMFSACRSNPASERPILRDVAAARRLGISGTPSFLIGRIEGNTLTVVRMSQGAPGFEAFANEIEVLRHPPAPVTPQTK